MLNMKLYEQAVEQVYKTFTDVDTVKRLYKINTFQAEKEIEEYKEARKRTSLGDRYARLYLITSYSKVLKNLGYDDPKVLNNIINFNNISKNSVYVIFEALLMIFDLSELLKEYVVDDSVRGLLSEKELQHTIEDEFTEFHVRMIAEDKASQLIDFFSEEKNRIDLLSTILYSNEYGQACIDSMQHHGINEIGVLHKDYIYVIFRGCKIWLSFLHFKSNQTIFKIQKNTTSLAVSNYDENNPSLIASKYNSSRITVAGFDLTPDDSNYYSERIFNLGKITLEQLKDVYNTLDEMLYEFLVLNQKGRGSHFVTGADMGVGKSTFLLALLEKVPNKWGIGILDTQNELQAGKKYPNKNIMTLIESQKRSISQCFEVMLKKSRDVLYVGEIAKPEEVAELINASLRLNSGVGTTMHNKSPHEVVTNVRNLLMRTDMYKDSETAESDIASSLDLIIHLKKLRNGRIVVESVSEVVEIIEEYNAHGLILGNQADVTLNDKISNTLDLLQIYLSRKIYTKPYYINTIISYNENTDAWDIVGKPSDGYYNKMGIHLYKSELDKMKSLFGEF